MATIEISVRGQGISYEAPANDFDQVDAAWQEIARQMGRPSVGHSMGTEVSPNLRMVTLTSRSGGMGNVLGEALVHYK